MQFISKTPLQPNDWDDWFTVPPDRRSFDYNSDRDAMPNLRNAKEYLLREQHFLCAYCQSSLSIDNASIEHCIPKSKNKSLSTSYHNLIVVCKTPIKDPYTGKLHCDKSRGNSSLPLFVFLGDSKCEITSGHPYFEAGQDGYIRPNRKNDIYTQFEIASFIEKLNLNHEFLVASRREKIRRSVFDAFKMIPPRERKGYLQYQYYRIDNARDTEFRQFLLICIKNQL